MDSPLPRLIALESDSIGFVSDLEALDRISPRTADTVHVFYARSGQRNADEILQNVVSAVLSKMQAKIKQSSVRSSTLFKACTRTSWSSWPVWGGPSTSGSIRDGLDTFPPGTNSARNLCFVLFHITFYVLWQAGGLRPNR